MSDNTTPRPTGETISLVPVGWFNSILHKLGLGDDIEIIEEDGQTGMRYEKSAEDLLGDLVNKLIEQGSITTMVNPSNAARLHQECVRINLVIAHSRLSAEDKEELADIAETIEMCANNLDPKE
jgi:hypothetical protein